MAAQTYQLKTSAAGQTTKEQTNTCCIIKNLDNVCDSRTTLDDTTRDDTGMNDADY
jgi:hypothetical protein